MHDLWRTEESPGHEKAKHEGGDNVGNEVGRWPVFVRVPTSACNIMGAWGMGF